MSSFRTYTKFDYKKNDIIPEEINDFRVWKLTHNMLNENIIGRANKHQNEIKNWKDILSDDYKNSKNSTYRTKIKSKNPKKRYTFHNYLSPNVNRIVTEVGRLVSEIKTSEENLSKLNINSLINTKNNLQKLEKLQEETTIVKLKEKEYQASLEGKIKKPPNYKYLSDNYRKQLNRAFLSYHPKRHLNNINSLIKENPETEKEFREHTKIIDNEIHNITSPNFYKRQYNKLQKMFSENKEKENMENDDDNNSLDEHMNKIKSSNIVNRGFSLPKIANKTSMGFHRQIKYYPTETDLTSHIKRNNKFNMYKFDKKNKKRIKTENRRKFPDKEGRKLELELMEDACKKMMKSIKYFDDENENDFFYKYSRLNSDERKRETNNILKDNIDTEKILLKIQNNNILKNIGEDMDNKTRKLNDDIKDYGKKINYIKDEIIKDIEENELKEHKYIV